MKLVRVLWALCLAWTIAIFPIAAPHAHAQGGHVRASRAHVSQDHNTGKGAHAHRQNGSGHQHVVGVDPCSGHKNKKCGSDAPACCGTIACHAFLAGVTPDLRVSRLSVNVAPSFVEERADGLFPTSLDRPPRPV